MTDMPRQQLHYIITHYGRSICDEPKRCEALLKDLCPQHKREVNLLVGALREGVAEVNNTFGGHYSYLLYNADHSPLQDGQELRATKDFHVSPFNEIEGGYRFRFHLDRSVPLARIDYDDAEGELLLTSISGKARAWSTSALLGAFAKMPFLTAGVMFRIHWQALKLWLKGVPFRGAHVPQPLRESTK